MFYFYGRKKKPMPYYPLPQYDLIIEPFAGAASYSLHGENWKHPVLLIERDEQVAEVWRWLIEDAQPSDIRALPSLSIGEKSSEFLHIVHAASKMAFTYKTIKVTPFLQRNWDVSRRVMAQTVPRVKHWTVLCGDYTLAPDVEATWFIDPPYKGEAGMGYAHGSNKIDYSALARWISARRGQTIACEGQGGDYLPFIPLRELIGVAGKKSQEYVWLKGKHGTLFDERLNP